MDISIPEDDAVAETVDRIMLLRETYPNIMKASMGNQETLRLALNEIMGIEYSERDVWTDRTTTGNQYRFFLNHISLLTDCFVINLRKKQIEVSNVSAIELVLNGSEDTMKRPGYNYTERM